MDAVKALKTVRQSIKEAKAKANEIAMQEFNVSLDEVTDEQLEVVQSKAREMGVIAVMRADNQEKDLDVFLSEVSNIANAKSEKVAYAKDSVVSLNMMTPTAERTQDAMIETRHSVIANILSDTHDKEVSKNEAAKILEELNSLVELTRNAQGESVSQHTVVTTDMIDVYLRKINDINTIIDTIPTIINVIFDNHSSARMTFAKNVYKFYDELIINITLIRETEDSDVISKLIDDLNNTMDILTQVGDNIKDILVTNSDVVLTEAIKSKMAQYGDQVYVDAQVSRSHIFKYVQKLTMEIYQEALDSIIEPSQDIIDLVEQEIASCQRLHDAYELCGDGEAVATYGKNYLAARKKPLPFNDSLKDINEMMKTIGKIQARAPFPGYDPQVKNNRQHMINAVSNLSRVINTYNSVCAEIELEPIPTEHAVKLSYGILISMACMVKKLTRKITEKDILDQNKVKIYLVFNTMATLHMNPHVLHDMYQTLLPVFDQFIIPEKK